MDSAPENRRYLREIARIRGFYRTLSPDAATFYAPEHGRWPEAAAESLRLGSTIAHLTTSASMIAFINSIVVGASAMWFAGDRLGHGSSGGYGGNGRVVPFAIGVAAAVLLMALFFLYQRWRFNLHALEVSETASATRR